MITILLCLSVYMHLLADEGEAVLAVEIGAILKKYPITGATEGARILDQRLAEIKSSLPQSVIDAAESCGRARDLLEIGTRMLTALEEEIGD